MRAPLQLCGETVHVGASIGCATGPVDGVDFAGLLHAADQRMYRAKHLVG